MNIPDIELKDYEYTLPEERIAKHPLEKRDHSKLLQYQGGKISHHRFFDLPEFIKEGSLLVYNDTKVIPARLIFQRKTGAKIEIFLLKPIAPSTVIPEVMLSRSAVTFETMIGNIKRWKDDEILQGVIEINGQLITIEAELLDRDNLQVRFQWNNADFPFVDIVEASGEVPLPPYLNRKPIEEDKSRYQTIYSRNEGAVAAPTAGLHFTEDVLNKIKANGVNQAEVTLHVSAGTFQPIKVDKVEEHPMHSEQIHLSKETIKQVRDSLGKIIAVGTTSVRTLESLYWFGVKLIEDKEANFEIEKLIAYKKRETLPNPEESLNAVIDFMERTGRSEIMGTTEIFIFPGYTYQLVNGLITNFHQPGSTLILLIATILGEDWKKVYQEALENGYRFLSYGDSSLLWIQD